METQCRHSVDTVSSIFKNQQMSNRYTYLQKKQIKKVINGTMNSMSTLGV